MKKHKWSVHQGIRPYACEHCDKRFDSKYGLDRHSTTHTGEQPFTCDQCQSDNLRKHQEFVHLGLRSYACKPTKTNLKNQQTPSPSSVLVAEKCQFVSYLTS